MEAFFLRPQKQDVPKAITKKKLLEVLAARILTNVMKELIVVISTPIVQIPNHHTHVNANKERDEIFSTSIHKLCDTDLIYFSTFIWTLLKGFEGDGYSCSYIDVCKTGNHGCDLNAECISAERSFTCECRQGKRLNIVAVNNPILWYWPWSFIGLLLFEPS